MQIWKLQIHDPVCPLWLFCDLYDAGMIHFINEEVESQRRPGWNLTWAPHPISGLLSLGAVKCPHPPSSAGTRKPSGQPGMGWAEEVFCRESQSHWQRIIHCVSVKAFCLNHFPSAIGKSRLGKRLGVVRSVSRSLTQQGKKGLKIWC